MEGLGQHTHMTKPKPEGNTMVGDVASMATLLLYVGIVVLMCITALIVGTTTFLILCFLDAIADWWSQFKKKW